jgi:hypothetical protein
MDSNLSYLRGKIRKLMDDLADYVATGSATDWADYRHKVGVIEGLALAERELLDLVDKLKEQE